MAAFDEAPEAPAGPFAVDHRRMIEEERRRAESERIERELNRGA